MSITVQNLSKHYGRQVAVNNISFSLNKGEIVGFLGPNGAGKSTTMKMITGFLPSDGGEITVSGIPVQYESIETKKHIGYLPESNPLYNEMYVREYLEFIAGVHKINNVKTSIDKVIQSVGLGTEAHKKIGQLSKGYKQRVGLAAALIHNPEVLILDEPTSGLDPNQIIEIRNVIKSLASNKTILFSSHIMQEVEAICDRVIIIHKGNIVADENISMLRKSQGEVQSILVEFKGDVNADLLNNINAVKEVKSLGQHKFQLLCSDADAVKKQLLQFSLEHNLDVVSLQSQQQSLEAVFKSLTSDN
ncbi:MAG: gliding motility-associated ABC transporter ATP-binding subunit GldA [Ferruginibacter sp.]